MNIMIFADQESKLLYEHYDPERMKDIDLIISCGDLPPEYLTFFATLCHAPLKDDLDLLAVIRWQTAAGA